MNDVFLTAALAQLARSLIIHSCITQARRPHTQTLTGEVAQTPEIRFPWLRKLCERVNELLNFGVYLDWIESGVDESIIRLLTTLNE